MNATYRHRRRVERLMFGATAGATFATLGVLVFLLGYIAWQGATSLSWSFFTALPAPVGEAPGHELGEADRGAEAERERDRDRDRGRGERPVDEGEGAEAERDRVPRRRPEEAPPEGCPRQRRAPQQHDGDGARDGDHREREGEREGAKRRITEPSRAARPGRRDADRGRGEESGAPRG